MVARSQIPNTQSLICVKELEHKKLLRVREECNTEIETNIRHLLYLYIRIYDNYRKQSFNY